MALRLEDCSHKVRAQIEKQLKAELDKHPRTEVTYALCSQICGAWHFGPPTQDRKAIEKAVLQMQNRNGRAAYQTTIGNPPAVMIEITTTVQPTT